MKTKVTFREVCQALKDRTDWLVPHADWKVDDDGSVFVGQGFTINLDTEVDICYYWYHHMMPNERQDEIHHAIESGNFLQFDELYQHYFEKQLRTGMCYLPSEASVHVVGEEDGWFGTLTVVYKPELFDLITHEECECG